jgi:hypothetical protein
MARKRILVTLPSDAHRRLATMAEQEERAVDQQASLLLKRLLTGGERQPAAVDRPGGGVAAAHAAEADQAPAKRPPHSVEPGEGGLSS